MLLLVMVGCGAPESTLAAKNPAVPEDARDDTAADDTAADDTAADDTAADTASPSEYVYEEEEDPGNLLSVEEVAVALERGVGAVLHEMDPFLVLEAFDVAMAAEDASCPYHYEDYEELYGYDYWYGGCSTADGSSFSGTIYGINHDPFWSWYYYYPAYGWWYGTAGVNLADGQSMELSGSWSMYRYEYGASAYIAVSAYGDARWTGARYGDTWLGGNASASYSMSGGSTPGYGAYLSMDGGISALPGTANAVWFDEVYIASAEQGSTCPEEPSGTISIRDAAGDWYDVEFHGPAYAYASSFPASCDGCGDVWYEGRKLGEACVDFASLTAWTATPW